MGCISSKIIARSLSYHEERMQGSRRSANDIPLLEDIIISANGSDQYLALVCAANNVTNKLYSRSFSSNKSPKQAIESACSETIEKLEISSRQEQEGGKQIEGDEKTRSKSWHWFPDYIVSSLAQESLFDIEEQHDLNSKGAARSRSFHTVEDYDDMVNRIWLSKYHSVDQCEFNDEEDNGSVTNMDLQVSEDKDSAIKKVQPFGLHKKYSFQERKIVEKKSILSTASESSVVSTSPKSQTCSSGIKHEVVPNQKTNISTMDKGNKRKALAERLESLRVPSNIESPAVARLREWLPAGGIYSPGSYVTPKFGSYSLMDIKNANESSENEDSIFSPELVSAFEQCMQELNADEENILKQIMEGVEEESY
ncbi:hypothetical protein TanjilG_17879 [Lupinus angustifolius]|uniref:Uncharacterized protein n=1 Tax=Lupinus angustifolius TaxID=3871 RepID=A0A4P1QQE6_LUPAN|nr:PREDICTED: uncharacterized protein LOC109334184 isoform X1 [Lupinus angustifolius]XP_019425341.1 PREDICTED: uncharacterized protein LOC109334184 isoform X1 [Lupinus angustifolius]XP_019425342.1 PREDICTED: uncharacterized protein LOC109334184 isoform X1 [Lupinus angustifolius]OIV91887.1 hypothetical protein TanjilG_17879 [Lupinus angustifolius]